MTGPDVPERIREALRGDFGGWEHDGWDGRRHYFSLECAPGVFLEVATFPDCYEFETFDLVADLGAAARLEDLMLENIDGTAVRLSGRDASVSMAVADGTSPFPEPGSSADIADRGAMAELVRLAAGGGTGTASGCRMEPFPGASFTDLGRSGLGTVQVGLRLSGRGVDISMRGHPTVHGGDVLVESPSACAWVPVPRDVLEEVSRELPYGLHPTRAYLRSHPCEGRAGIVSVLREENRGLI